MGGCQSRGDCETSDIDELLIKRIGCDTKGTILCQDEQLECLNGGVCALYKSDKDMSCVTNCRCTPEYYGEFCESDAAFLAKYGLAAAIFCTLIVVIFLTIFIWYCCKRKKKEDKPDAPTRAPRAYLGNRFDTTTHNTQPEREGKLDNVNYVESGKTTPYEMGEAQQGNENCILQSYNDYETNGQGWINSLSLVPVPATDERAHLLSRQTSRNGSLRIVPVSPLEGRVGPMH